MSASPYNLILRSALPTDKPFVAETWLQSYSTSPTRWSLQDTYFKVWPSIIERLLRVSNVTVATLLDDPGLILGYIVTEPNEQLLHYIYVRGKSSQSAGLQREGIGSALIQSLGNLGDWTSTHRTRLSMLVETHRHERGQSVTRYDPARLLGVRSP